MKIQFNTGRPYTAEGQIVVVEYDHTTGIALFSDKSRMVDGKITLPAGLLVHEATAAALAKAVMHAYDHGNYEGAPFGCVRSDDKLLVVDF